MTTSVLTINEISIEAESEGIQNSYTREWEIVCSDGLASESFVATQLGVGYLSAHPDNFFALCRTLKLLQNKQSPAFWHATAHYKTQFTSEEQEKSQIVDPTKRKPVVTGGWESMRMPVRHDRDGKLITNSANQVPEQVPEVDGFLTTLNFKANVYPIPDWVITYRSRYGCINSDAFTIELESGQTIDVEAGQAKLHSVYFSELKYEADYQFYELSFSLTLRDPPITDTDQEGWVFDMVDQGMMQYTDDKKGLQKCVDQNGQEVTSPVPLDGHGKQLDLDNTGSGPDLVVLYKDIYPLKDFSVLPACS